MNSTDEEEDDDEKTRERRSGVEGGGDEDERRGEGGGFMPAMLYRRRHAGATPPCRKFADWAISPHIQPAGYADPDFVYPRRVTIPSTEARRVDASNQKAGRRSIRLLVWCIL